jgi:hypothetical protein
MAISAQSIVRRCVDILQDSSSVRWPVDELVRYLNDGQREVALYRPDALVQNSTVTLVTGSKQTIPSDGSKLIEIVRNNSTGSKKAVRLVNREILDAQTPDWHDITGQDEILHYMYDPRDRDVFYVYPPATTSAKLDIVYSIYPSDIAEPGNGATWEDVTGNINVPDIYGNVIQDYILYRAYTKDSEYAGNANRAQAHYATFANALGIEISATIQAGPQSPTNPNAPVPAAP